MNIDSQATLYLIPNTLGDDSIERALPSHNSKVVTGLRHFLVEDEKSARKLIKQLAPSCTLRDLHIERLNEHTKPEQLDGLMKPLRAGEDVGIISDAGCPAIADPGAEIVRLAHLARIKVVPLIGPCSMVLALMASGFNGQMWRFQGYLPVEGPERYSVLRSLEQRVESLSETQIFMDTPYRTERLLSDIFKVCKPSTMLCVAQGLTSARESIRTASVQEWRNMPLSLEKLPSLFILGK